MKEFFQNIFREYPSIPMIMGNDEHTIVFNVIGDAGIFVFFSIMGILCLFFLNNTMPKEAYKQRRNLTRLLGFALFSCALSRGLNVLALWHNYAFLNGIIKISTVISSLTAFLYLPYTVKAIQNTRSLDEVKTTMELTSKKVDELAHITKKVIDKEK